MRHTYSILTIQRRHPSLFTKLVASYERIRIRHLDSKLHNPWRNEMWISKSKYDAIIERLQSLETTEKVRRDTASQEVQQNYIRRPVKRQEWEVLLKYLNITFCILPEELKIIPITDTKDALNKENVNPLTDTPLTRPRT